MATSLNDLYLSLRRRLRDADIESADLEARELAALAANVDRHMTADWGYLFLSDDTLQYAEALTARRLASEPLAYILGEWDFYGLTFQVTPKVLIPRPETERLCELAIEHAKTLKEPRVLDLCCGTGCIGIALAKNVPEARVVLVDVSEEALSVARENVRRHELGSRVTVVHGDALEAPGERYGEFQLLVCNPPYVTADEMELLDESVRNYEPHDALYGGINGLDFYESIATHWQHAMCPGGKMMFECGFRQATQVASILEEHGMKNIVFAEDLAGIQRIVMANIR